MKDERPPRTADEQASDLIARRCRQSPRVVQPDACPVAQKKPHGSRITVAIEPGTVCAAFGISNIGVASRLLSQLVNVLHPDPTKPVDTAAISQALDLVGALSPTNALEGMTATLLVAAQHAALDSLRRAMHPSQTPAGRALYGVLALKAMRTYAQLLETLDRGRGNGVTQQIIVKHVTVEPGGQAVVGPVNVSGGGGGARFGHQS
jgi:hypothetical protein